ncbi:UDP-galactopyranose mutase [Pollutimonas nitritireducens]|uniref:UDP-galactopyranose mutase n=1 Tax=Pollutimonas nitritireducens TaxID=2045209 RepID=A0A2N4UH22_9BURK|nr:UDP-galactopyranose mutase [Pollutimonas nitritireducens]
MSRFANEFNVQYVEEPIWTDEAHSRLEIRDVAKGIRVLVPRLGDDAKARPEQAQRELLDLHLGPDADKDIILWYYTPMSLTFSQHLRARLVIYDCMDELSAFRDAPLQLVELERRLMKRADILFTGGHSLYEAKRLLHDNAYAFPSSVDIAHFAKAREPLPDPADQAGIPSPRLGFYGVLDERLDIDLIDKLAALRPDWHLVLVGPVVKIDPASLPTRPNIHYLGAKTYDALPHYLAGWDVALMPFALNASTRFISPTKTPEYLAGGRAVVSTPITDVVRSYGASPIVRIARTARGFAEAIQQALQETGDRPSLLREADVVLDGMSWDRTWWQMRRLMEKSLSRSQTRYDVPGTKRRTDYDYLIVGAGFGGSVLAERLARGLDKRVLVIDRRPHIGGNAYDFHNEDGLLVHKYGPHIFHTNSEKVFRYLSDFTRWRPYEHRVLAQVDGMLVPMPINLTTLGMLYGREFTSDDAVQFLAARAERLDHIKTSEDIVVSTVGRELYEKFFRGYTRKQWGLDPSELNKSVAARIPTRTSLDDRYFTDSIQCMPLHGYTRMFENMLSHPNITVATGTGFNDIGTSINYDHLIYCGPIDEFFDYRYGRLPYRSLEFRHVTLGQQRFQPVGVVNFPGEDVPYTRITEYKHLTGQQHRKTSITYEIPCAEGDPYYPVPRPENFERFHKYLRLGDATPRVTFVGRLATYRYYNMDQVVAQALTVYARIAELDAKQQLPYKSIVEAA